MARGPGGVTVRAVAELELTEGAVGAETARGNREAVEAVMNAGGAARVGPGEYHLDRALDLRRGRLEGAGMGETVLRNRHTGSGHHSRTLVMVGAGYGYHDAATADAEGAAVLGPDSDPANYAPGCVAWGLGGARQRYTVRAVDGGARRVLFDRPFDPAHGALKWCAGCAVEDVGEGQDGVRLLEPAPFAPGAWVHVGDGPSLANEARGEYRRVVAVEGADVRLDRPLRQSYAAAALVRIRPVEGVWVSDLTIAQPLNAQADPLFMKFAAGVRFERVRVGIPGEDAWPSEIVGCSDVVFGDCELLSGVNCNTTHDVAFRGGRHAEVKGEEGCFDIEVADTLISRPGGGQHGISFYLGCDRITVRNARVEGAGHWGGGGFGSPLAFSGRGCRVLDTRVSGSVFEPGYSRNFLGGDGLRVEGLHSDTPTDIVTGKGIRLAGSYSRWWDVRAGTSGTASDCEPAVPRGKGWKVRD